MRRALPWLLAGALVASLFAGQIRTSAARDEAIRERGRVEELIRARALAEDLALESRRIATARGDSAEMARQETERVRLEAGARAQAARVRATDAEGRLRTALDSLGASSEAVDSLIVAHEDVLSARDSVIAVQAREIVAVRSYAEGMVLALDAADARSVALEAERDSYRRQAEAWAKVAQPGILRRLATEAGRAAVWGGAGFLLGRLAR